MVKKIILGAGAVATALLISGGVVFAQSASPSPSPSPTPSPSASAVVPSAAPATGFGSN